MPNITPSRTKNSIHRSLSQIIYGYPNNKDKQVIWHNQAKIKQLNPKVEQEINQIINQAKLEFDKAVAKMRQLKQQLDDE